MSQHHFFTEHEESITHVFMGWDTAIKGFFLTIFKNYDDDEPYFDNLKLKTSHTGSVGPWIKVLADKKIFIPYEMLTELKEDQSNDIGEKEVVHVYRNGEYKRLLNQDVFSLKYAEASSKFSSKL